jgi:hypothetical protein
MGDDGRSHPVYVGGGEGEGDKAVHRQLRQLALQHNSYLCTDDLYSPVHNVLGACISITRASGRGLGPGNLEF